MPRRVLTPTPKQKKEFFEEVSKNCNYGDIQNVMAVYYAIVRTISQQAVKRGFVFLPELGKIEMRYRKSKRVVNVNDGKDYMSTAYHNMHFIPLALLQKFINYKIEGKKSDKKF